MIGMERWQLLQSEGVLVKASRSCLWGDGPPARGDGGEDEGQRGHKQAYDFKLSGTRRMVYQVMAAMA